MKILLISVDSDEAKGGIAVWTKQYLKGCKSKGLSCEVVNTKVESKTSNNASGKRSVKNEFLRMKRINKQLRDYLKAEYYDVAHLNTNIGLFGIIRDYYIAKKITKKKIPLALHFHCDIPYWVKNSLIKYYLKKILKISDVNFVLCENSYKYLKKEFNVESIKFPNFISERLVIDNKNIKTKMKNICFVGRISRAKGAKEIFQIAKKFPEINFSLAGVVSQEVSMWKKPLNIKLLGPLSHKKIIELLDNCDALLFPSYTEGFSLAVAESMARGLPILASDVGANSEMIEKEGGIIFSVSNIAEIEEGINKLKDYEIRANMSKWCIKKVKENYTTDKIMNKFIEQYKKIIKGG